MHIMCVVIYVSVWRIVFIVSALHHASHQSSLLFLLQCVMLKETANDEYPLYAKIGCQHRDTYTSTKLQLIVYVDKQCSKPYSEDEINSDGYDLNGYFLSNKVRAFVAFSFVEL